ncbi:hypothetical protein Sjap_003341 [Stephania japonica]|uniref:Pentatricopeptide repeat-containing protein n=1 Tax=Stephania japonica TaxID=461633 RepID=A0AAP0PX10_9MAGN
MKSDSVEPDSQTFSYLICNCECEEDIIKYYEEMQNAGVRATKQVYMSLINAYANCGQFEKAKQVLGEQGIPVKNINELKSVLVSVLASSEHLSDALEIYDEVQQSGGHLEPKAIIALIENLHCEGNLDRMLQLLGELRDLDFWLDGCSRIVSYCIRHEYLSAVVELLKQIKDKDAAFTKTVLEQAFCQISETKHMSLNLGLDLIKDCKEILNIHPSRSCLDFLLRGCIVAKDPHHAHLIWKEYEKAKLPYNSLTFLSMCKVLCDSGEHKAAMDMLKRIDKEDPHVRHLIKKCRETFKTSKEIGRAQRAS